MVSLPAVKRVSLEVSKLLKGAAIAKRISIAGVSCFIISKESYLRKFFCENFESNNWTYLLIEIHLLCLKSIVDWFKEIPSTATT